MGRVNHPEGGEDPDNRRVVDVEPQEGVRPENGNADNGRRARGSRRQPECGAELFAEGVPDGYGDRGPQDFRPEEQTGSWEERDKHVDVLLPVGGSARPALPRAEGGGFGPSWRVESRAS